ncbi:MAG: exodeoxyribonuclease V subunit gamma [Arenimonas sp.]|jgi:exodeoxyribonuclease V gamma subunit
MPAAPIDFRLYHGNDLEVLAGVLARELARSVDGDDLLAPDTILIPQPAMRRWLQKTLAERHGIAANLRFLAPGEFVREALDGNVPGAGEASVGDAATLRWRLWALLADVALMREPVFAPLQPALAGADGSLAAWALAGELADAFEKYQAWRRDWLRRWDHGGDRGDWQAELWRRATRHLSHRGKRLDAYLSRFDGDTAASPSGLPKRVFAFGCQNVSPDVLRVIASSARAGTLHFFFLSPVAGWWGDLLAARERLHADHDGVFDDQENPLLRANGSAGRDFVRTLFSFEVAHPSFELALYEPPDPQTRRGLLHRLQRDLLARNPLPALEAQVALPPFDAVAREDRSLQVHACHTRLREVQVLHDQLRRLLEEDASLQPRDIAVLTPDIDQYAAHVHAVFGGGNQPLQHIPYALSDGSAIAGQPLAEAFLRLLMLPASRFTANEVLELLAVPAVAQRLQLEAADFELLRFWLREAGARWGLDAAHRSALGAPAEDAYTWAWALDRLLLGHASGSRDDIAGVAPWPELEGSAVTTLDALLQGLQKLAQLQHALGGRHDAAEWQTLLSQMLDSLFADRPLDAGDRRALEGLRAQIATFGRQTAAAAVPQAVPLSVVQAWFRAALGDSEARQPFLSGGVTFGRMVPMRLVPFKVICLLGMNDGDFPRRDPIGSLNRLSAETATSQRRTGDRSIRDDDRGLFLQLFAAATQTFYVSYLGRDPRSGETQPPSVVVAELLDVASRYFAEAARVREQLTVVHPLQPFAAEAFGRDDPRRISYQSGWRAAADGGHRARVAMPPFASELPARDMSQAPLLTRDALVRALCNPPKYFLSEGVGLRLPERSERLPDAEPFDRRDGLHRYQLLQRMFQAGIAGDAGDLQLLCRRLLAEGLIAPGAFGLQEVAALLAELTPAIRTWRGWGMDAAQVLPYQLQLGATALSGALAPVHASGLRQFSASRAHGRTLLGLGVDALIWSALGQTRPIQRLIIGEPPEVIAPLPAAIARERLQLLVEIFSTMRQSALPFMPKAGFAYFKHPPGAAAARAARNEWTTHTGFGEGEDAWVRLALRGIDPFRDGDPRSAQAFGQLANAIFRTLPGAPELEEPAHD